MSVPAGTGTGPNQTKSAARAVRNVSKNYNYTLTVVPYPSGFNPGCQESNITIWGKVGSYAFSPNPFFELAGLEQPDINVGNCLASTGDSMHANLDVQYGNMRFIAGSGNFKLDSTDDSAALLTITDNTTGYSSNVQVYLSY